MAASDVIGSGTAGGLMAFCDYLTDRGIAPASAVSPWKSAAKNVFAKVEGSDDFDAVDIQALDIDEYMSRFVNKSRGDYKPDSLNAYANRFRKGVEAYRGYLADPMGWKPKLRASSAKRSPDAGNGVRTGGGAAPASGGGTAQVAAQQTPTPPLPLPGLITYPFPLRSGQIAQLQLPSPLEKDDADRLTQFVRALVFERQPQLSSGDSHGE